jgi:hypothetical protein
MNAIPRPGLLDAALYAAVAVAYGTFVVLDNPFFALFLVGGGALVAAVAGLGVLARTLLRRDWASTLLLAVAAAVPLAAYHTAWPARRAYRYVAFVVDRPALERVVRTVTAAPRVRRISAGDRYWKFINRTPVRDLGAPTPVVGEPAGPSEAQPAAVVLRREGIAPASYRAIREGLLDAGYLSVEVWPDYVLFEEDGMLGKAHGVLYVRPGHAPPSLGPPQQAGRPHLAALRPLGNGWFTYSSM